MKKLLLAIIPCLWVSVCSNAEDPTATNAKPHSPAEQGNAGESCAQPSPEEMAKSAGVRLPRQPWHVANIWWEFEKPTEHFTSLEVDVTIDRDVPSSYNLYIAPCGLARISGKDFYGGLQSNINGWANATNHTRVHPGKGAIFSRWSSDKKTPVGLENVRTAGPDCLIESAGYEGEFCSVRRPFAWTKGTYTYQIVMGQNQHLVHLPREGFPGRSARDRQPPIRGQRFHVLGSALGLR